MNLKIVATLLLLLASIPLCHAQDMIVLKNGDEVKSKVVEVSSDEVKYKKFDNLEGPVYSVPKSDVFMIKYKNGTKDVFPANASNKANAAPSNEDSKKAEGVKRLEAYVRGKLNKDATVLSKFTKTNGAVNNAIGQNVYTVSFEVEMEFIADGWLKGNDLEGYWRNSFYVYGQMPNLAASGEQYMYGTKMYAKGQLVSLGCEAQLSNTDNGYEVTEVRIKTTQNKGNVEKDRIEKFVTEQFNRGYKMVVRDYQGKEIPSTTDPADNQSYYHISRNGDSKFIVLVHTYTFKPLARETELILKSELYDRDYAAPNFNKDSKVINTTRVDLKAGSSSYSYEQRIDLFSIDTRLFGLEEFDYYIDNTTWGGGILTGGQFKFEGDFVSNRQQAAPMANKKNTIYGSEDIKLVQSLVDLSQVEFAGKEAFMGEFKHKAIIGRSKLRFEQSKEFDDILIGYEQRGNKQETQSNYMYYKGILFCHSGNILIVIRKLREGLGSKLFILSPPSSLDELLFEK